MERLATRNPSDENLNQLRNQEKLANELLQSRKSCGGMAKRGNLNTKFFHG